MAEPSSAAEPAGETAQPILNIVGERVALGPPRRELLTLHLRWINDLATQRTVSPLPRPWTLEQERGWLEGLLTTGERVPFTIYERSTLRPIGSTNLLNVDPRNGTAEFGLLIGEPDARGKGYGTETTRLMLDYGFTALGLHSVMLRVLAYNPAGVRAYEKAGFRQSGRRREAHWMNGRSWDVIVMDCLASEFTSPVLGKVFASDKPGPAAGDA